MSNYTDDMNMYGCTPCSECGSIYRCVFNTKPYTIICDECLFEEGITEQNYGLYPEKMRNKKLREEGVEFIARGV